MYNHRREGRTGTDKRDPFQLKSNRFDVRPSLAKFPSISRVQENLQKQSSRLSVFQEDEPSTLPSGTTFINERTSIDESVASAGSIKDDYQSEDLNSENIYEEEHCCERLLALEELNADLTNQLFESNISHIEKDRYIDQLETDLEQANNRIYKMELLLSDHDRMKENEASLYFELHQQSKVINKFILSLDEGNQGQAE